jgi:hypothetical protein
MSFRKNLISSFIFFFSPFTADAVKDLFPSIMPHSIVSEMRKGGEVGGGGWARPIENTLLDCRI